MPIEEVRDLLCVALREAGLSLAAIGRQVNRHKSNVLRRLRRLKDEDRRRLRAKLGREGIEGE